MKNIHSKAVAGIAVGASLFVGLTAWSDAQTTVTSTMSCPVMGDRIEMAEKPVQATQSAKVQRATIVADEKGYTPANIEVKVGKPVELTFIRKSDKTCATEVVMPDYKIKAALPLGRPVKVKFTPKKSGAIAFACGMNMFRGQIVAK